MPELSGLYLSQLRIRKISPHDAGCIAMMSKPCGAAVQFVLYGCIRARKSGPFANTDSLKDGKEGVPL